MLLLLCTVIGYAQPTFLRSTSLYFGTFDANHKIKWDDGKTSNVLIKVDENHITVYSETQQDFYIAGKLSETENVSQWKAIDHEGVDCTLWLGYSTTVNSTYMMVQYNNIAICLYTKSE